VRVELVPSERAGTVGGEARVPQPLERGVLADLDQVADKRAGQPGGSLKLARAGAELLERHGSQVWATHPLQLPCSRRTNGGEV